MRIQGNTSNLDGSTSIGLHEKDVKNQPYPLRLSLESLHKNEPSKPTESESDEHLPDNIRKLKAYVKQIKERLETAKQALAELKERIFEDEEQKAAQIKLQSSVVNSLNFELMNAAQALQKALEDQGVTDPSVLVDVLV
ncbi:hypothetical protein NI389_05480 [Pseudoalteromonas xiamenensis]|uniref:hypothetical protein n=1 Tax=Pseudoalteromonas xiamenensis TaxID=882626 RepID=UPI0027E4BABB|nr:hypothetical protein [Pseudoalteromonas xiamenensis]WMN60861.1 hypothetical protein NI389_05480 [Pseudoalteromonas xiamenensis]